MRSFFYLFIFFMLWSESSAQASDNGFYISPSNRIEGKLFCQDFLERHVVEGWLVCKPEHEKHKAYVVHKTFKNESDDPFSEASIAYFFTKLSDESGKIVTVTIKISEDEASNLVVPIKYLVNKIRYNESEESKYGLGGCYYEFGLSNVSGKYWDSGDSKFSELISKLVNRLNSLNLESEGVSSLIKDLEELAH